MFPQFPLPASRHRFRPRYRGARRCPREVTGIDPGDPPFTLGNCLTMRTSPEAVNTPAMYAKIRHTATRWMSSGGIEGQGDSCTIARFRSPTRRG